MERAVKTSYKTYNIIDFFSFTNYSQSFCVRENMIFVGKVQVPKATIGQRYAVKNYELLGREFVYFSDGFLMEKRNGEYKKVLLTTLSSAPKMFTARYNGAKTIFAYVEGYLYSLGLYLDKIKVPEGKYYTEYKGGLYFISGRSIVFCKDFFKSKNVKIFSFVQTEEDEGAPVGICRIGTGLFVFFEYGIYKVENPFDEESIKLIKVLGIDKIKGAFSVKNQAYFVSENLLKKYDGKAVKTIIKIPECEIVDIVELSGFECAFLIERLGENYLLAYETEETAPYFIKVDTGHEFRLVDFQNNNHAYWESVQTDLGIKGKKFIRAIELGVNDNCTLTIEADGKERNYAVNKRHVNLGITAEKIRVKIFTDRPITITNLQFLYKKENNNAI